MWKTNRQPVGAFVLLVFEHPNSSVIQKNTYFGKLSNTSRTRAATSAAAGPFGAAS